MVKSYKKSQSKILEEDIGIDDIGEVEDNFNDNSHDQSDDSNIDTLNDDTDLMDNNNYMDDFGYNDNFDNYSVPPMEKHNDLLKELTNFSPYLKDTVNGWLGLTWDETQGKFVSDPNIRPIMNRHCAAWCISTLKTYTRGNNIITDIDSSEYKNMMADIIENIWMNIGTRSDTDFGITEDGDILRICNEMEHAAKLVLMGAGDGRYNKFLGGTMNVAYNGNSGMQMQPNPYMMNGYGNNNNYQNKKPGMLQKMKQVMLGQ